MSPLAIRFVAIGVALLVLGGNPCPGQEAKAPIAGVPNKEDYRYDGKNFDYWRNYMLTELKADRLIEALQAMKALGQRGYDAEASAAILRLMGDQLKAKGDDKVADAAIDALLVMQEAALPHLLEGLKSPTANIRDFCVNLLVKDKFVPGAAAVPALMDLIEKGNAAQVDAALNVLHSNLINRASGSYKSERVLLVCAITEKAFAAEIKKEDRAKALAKGLVRAIEANVEGGSRWHSVRLLNRMGPAASSVVPDLVEILKRTDESGERRDLVLALGKIGCDPKVTVPAAIRLLDEKRADDGILDYLGELGPKAKSAVPALLTGLEKGYGFWATDKDIVKTLVKTDDPERLVPKLLVFIREHPDRAENDEFLDAAFGCLEKLGPQRKIAVPELVKILSGIHEENKIAAKESGSYPLFPRFTHISSRCMKTLGDIGSDAKAALPVLNDIAATSNHDGLRKEATQAIAKIKGEDAPE